MANELVSLSNELASAVERTAAGLVAVQARPRIGTSGVIWRPNRILTASEGIRFEEGIRVLLPDGRNAEARLRGRDAGTDLALVEADTAGFSPLDFASDAALKVGHLVLAVGRTASTGPIASFGIISGVSGEWKTWRGGRLNPFVRLDISVYATSSGGAVVDPEGRVIGLVSIGLSRSSVLAVTRTTIDQVAQRLENQGYVSRGFLGIALQPVALPEELKKRLQLEQNHGIMLLGLEPDGPAALGGLILGDILLTAGGRTLASADDLADLLDRTAAGDTVNFRVLRAGAVREAEIRIGERPRRRK
ncbi:MAG TPA: S1C family serine protease [Bryobacteraceae bacterium]|nr:S1C family serine protease [Bryobacteraceae bacterium]